MWEGCGKPVEKQTGKTRGSQNIKNGFAKPKTKKGVENFWRGVERGFGELSTLPVDKFCAHHTGFSAAVHCPLTEKRQKEESLFSTCFPLSTSLWKTGIFLFRDDFYTALFLQVLERTKSFRGYPVRRFSSSQNFCPAHRGQQECHCSQMSPVRFSRRG